MTGETSQTLDRGIRVLRELAEAHGGLTVTELAARLGVNRTVMYRLLATLEHHSLVRRDADSRVRLGLGVLGLARRVQPLLRDAALPVLRRLAEEVGATAHLTIADGGEALAVAVVEPSWTDFHVAYRVGSRHPLSSGAAGRAIMLVRSGRSPGANSGVGGGSRSATGVAAGYVVSQGELQPGAHGVAAPVLGIAVMEASVGVVTLGPLDAAAIGPRVVAAAAELADGLR
ncbi:MAG TPA: helix-turn-helix domain-containing protein [Actinomycetes bacterium]|nr:helix-turn-helix domain-containing protein [Actinomycetes bacterium]